MKRNIKLSIARCSSPTMVSERLSRPDGEEYLSNDGSCLLQLQKDSEIRFGPAYYRATIYGGEGKLVLDFGDRRFFSYAGYGKDYSNWTGPWSPTSLHVALVELLNTHPEPGTKIARMNIFDVSGQMPLAAWDFESLVTHKMWSSDGRLYLFRDVYAIYAVPIERCSLVPISNSRSPHCFLLKDEFVCVIERTGEVSIFEGNSGTLLATNHISEAGYTVKHALVDERLSIVSVTLKCQTEPDAHELCYTITVQPGPPSG